jgi:hypothetical protein
MRTREKGIFMELFSLKCSVIDTSYDLLFCLYTVYTLCKNNPGRLTEPPSSAPGIPFRHGKMLQILHVYDILEYLSNSPHHDLISDS